MADCNTCSQYMSVEDILRRSIKCDANGNVAMQGGLLNGLSVTISNVTAETDNYVLPVVLHAGGNITGDTTGVDVYLNNRFANDFSDVEFTDSSGNKLDYLLHSTGNYEIVPDGDRLSCINLILKDGTLLACDIDLRLFPDHAIYRSIDNGNNWTKVLDGNLRLSWEDSHGNVFATRISDFKLLRCDYSDETKTTWAEVLDMSAVNGFSNHFGFDEDSAGNIYFGRYQYSLNVAIYKSTDRGLTWVLKYSQTTQQHVHGIYVDKFQSPEVIYAGLDGTPNLIIKSADAGETWTPLTGLPFSASFEQMYAADGYRIFAVEAGSGGGPVVFKTTDDSTYQFVVSTRHQGNGMMKLGNAIYVAAGSGYYNCRYPSLLRSTDGVNWQTVYFNGYNYSDWSAGGLRNITKPGTPIGDTEQVIVGGLDIWPEGTKDAVNHSSRIYDGGNHYQALFFVKIPTLTNNMKIKIVKKTTTTSQNIFDDITYDNLLGYWKINEGSGTFISDISGNERHGLLTAGSGEWSSGGERVGAIVPFIGEDYSYSFNASKVIITGSGSITAMQKMKDITIIAWVKITQITTSRFVVVRGADGSGRQTSLITTGGSIGVRGGSANKNYSTSQINVDGKEIPFLINDGVWHMIGVVFDNNNPTSVKFIIDGLLQDDWHSLEADQTGVIGDWHIGSDSGGVLPFLGNISGVQLYGTQLTKLQIRSIFEKSNVLAENPVISI